MYNKSNKAKIAVLASGRGSNFVAIQKAIDRGEIAARIAVLICDKPKAKVIEAAREFGIDVSIVDSAGLSNDEFDKKLVAELKGYAIDLILLAGFMKIVGRPLLENFPGKIINIHPSLLPSFKGVSQEKFPRQRAIQRGKIDNQPFFPRRQLPISLRIGNFTNKQFFVVIDRGFDNLPHRQRVTARRRLDPAIDPSQPFISAQRLYQFIQPML